jgi:RNA polymerase sigma-70 factor (ECF subfamily)
MVRADSHDWDEFGTDVPLVYFGKFLLPVARRKIDRELCAKVDPSDVVQQTLLEAHAGLPGFRGRTRYEFRAWLLCILRRNLANLRRHFRRNRRNIRLECRLDDEFRRGLPASRAFDLSPAQQAIHHEGAEHLAQLLHCLPQIQRQAIQLYFWQRLTWKEIGRQLGRSPDAARMLLTRALVRLRLEFRNRALD